MTAAQRIYRLPRQSLIFVIELYRTWISPMRMPTCRFEPTCSAYAVEALGKHGFLWGSVLATWRLLKCGPWHKPGYDPVPETGPAQWLHRSTQPDVTATQTSNQGAAEQRSAASTSDRGK